MNNETMNKPVAALSIARWAREVWKPRLHSPDFLKRYTVNNERMEDEQCRDA